MAVVVDKHTRLYSRLVVAISTLLLICVALLVGDFFAYRSFRGRVTSSDADLIGHYVQDYLTTYLATNPLPSAAAGSSAASSTVPHGPTFVCIPLSTWETIRGEQRAMIDGSDFGIGDYCRYGLVVSIRPRRVICKSSAGITIVASNSFSPSSSVVGDSPREAPIGGGEGENNATTW